MIPRLPGLLSALAGLLLGACNPAAQASPEDAPAEPGPSPSVPESAPAAAVPSPSASMPSGPEEASAQTEPLAHAPPAQEAAAPVLDAAPQGVETVVAGRNTLTGRLFGAVRAPDRNVLLSAPSVASALQMTMLGARGQTLAEFQALLGVDALAPEVAHAAAGHLQGTVTASETITVRMANRVWVSRALESHVAPSFSQTLDAAFDGGLEAASFAEDADGARQRINEWVAAQTNDKIPALLAPGTVTPATEVVLTNAVYFFANWATAFDPRSTEEAPFRRPHAAAVQVPMMRSRAHRALAHGSQWRGTVLPYADPDWEMVVVVPDAEAFETIAASPLDALQQTAATSTQTEMTLLLPRFRFRWNQEVSATLQQLGLVTPFGGGADFGAMMGDDAAGGLRISLVVQEAFIQVDEQGTEAAAATAVMMTRGAPSPAPELRCDQPFVFGVRHRPTGLWLFVGQVVDPLAP